MYLLTVALASSTGIEEVITILTLSFFARSATRSTKASNAADDTDAQGGFP